MDELLKRRKNILTVLKTYYHSRKELSTELLYNILHKTEHILYLLKYRKPVLYDLDSLDRHTPESMLAQLFNLPLS